jgi:hypothetical protein
MFNPCIYEIIFELKQNNINITQISLVCLLKLVRIVIDSAKIQTEAYLNTGHIS